MMMIERVAPKNYCGGLGQKTSCLEAGTFLSAPVNTFPAQFEAVIQAGNWKLRLMTVMPRRSSDNLCIPFNDMNGNFDPLKFEQKISPWTISCQSCEGSHVRTCDVAESRSCLARMGFT
jgi:hypothetical protein